MNKLQIAKTAVETLTSYGVGRSVSTIVTSTVPRQDNAILDAAVKISVFVTSWSVTNTIMEPVTANTNRKIDDIAAAIGEFQNKS